MPLYIVRSDITKMVADAIVNPSNEELNPSGGVDELIHEAAGRELYAACRALGGCKVGEAKATPAFALKAKYVIHTVGPRWQGGNFGEQQLLASCYRSCLMLAYELECESVAIPLISSGTHGYPKDRVLKEAVSAITAFLLEYDMTVNLVVYDGDSYEFSERLFGEIKSYLDGGDYSSVCSRITLERRLDQRKSCIPVSSSANPSGRGRRHVIRHSELTASRSLEQMLSDIELGFSATVMRLIRERGMKGYECYRLANVDKKIFSKMKNNPDYRPSKITAICFAIALRLNPEETDSLLRTAGYSLSKSSRFDIIVEYYISRGKYDIMEINQTLFEFDLPLLGSQ